MNLQVQRLESTKHPTGQVIDALPTPGERISAGDTVTVVVADNPSG